MGGTEIRAKGAEFGRIAVALGRARRGALAKNLLECLVGAFEHAADVAVLGVTVENAWQEIVDGDVARRRLPGEAAGETDQAGPGAVRQSKLGLRDFYAARHDVDYPPKPARGHAVDREAHHLDRAQHHV